ncbi:MAG TPA: sigma 54-interacting transcriptional regulator, partial [Deltaproteobacteria bacterium]|nr:sigma 54-interacting transcriptional regulator [Deltaproteobacteria bacterium]
GEHSGIDLLRELKLKGVYAPIIMITGRPDLENASASLRYGAFDYIVKPIRSETLLRVTKNALQHKVLQDEKRFLEQEKERYRMHLECIFNSVEEAIIMVDTELRVIEANHAASRLCGISSENPRSLIEPASACGGACRQVLADAFAKNVGINEYRIECKGPDGTDRAIVMSVSPIRAVDGLPSGAVMVLRDVTRIMTLERELKGRHQYHNIIGKSPRMQEVFRLLENLRDIETTVLVTGKSGTGKELVARAIHYGGARSSGPFIAVNCSALAENLLESELFGHVKGAFTGAIRDKAGRFELAHNGTLFLDEIGDIPPHIQLKLLRVLETKQIERVGDATPIQVDVQVITATNRDLKDLVHRGLFREDLYYRLKVVEVHLPALTERREDIPLLVDHFLALFRERFRKDISGVSQETMHLFMEYPWPGNVRELVHCMEHAFVMCRSHVIDTRDLPPEIRTFRSGPGVQLDAASRSHLERDDILNALKTCGGNRARAARHLGVSRQTLYRKMKEFGIP